MVARITKWSKTVWSGFRDCEELEYRFAPNNRHYPILNPNEELLIYQVDLPGR